MKKENFTENFDPYLRAKAALRDEDGLPAYEPLVVNGAVVMDGERIVLAPRAILDLDAHREWFHAAFPEGRTEVIRHTKETNPNKEVFEVRFFKDATDVNPAANGWGSNEEKPDSQFTAISCAIGLAWKNGMRNMGFGVDLDLEKMRENLPTYVERRASGAYSDVIPSAIPKTVLATPAAPAPAPAKAVAVPTAPAPAPVVEAPVPTAEPIPAAETVAATPGADPTEKLLAFITKREEASEPSAPTPSEDTVPLPSLEFASETLFCVLPHITGPLTGMAGKKMGTLAKENPSFIHMLVEPSFCWEKKIPADVYNAAVVLIHK